ncbi:MAG: PEP-CTERM sorting domain-containing protein [Myxococcota bacterium]|nr:PEP-CTERM sorting domain-containing protein [Myxococcota bacterium]
MSQSFLRSALRTIFRSIPGCALVLCASAFWAGSASAISFTTAGNDGQDVTPGQQVAVTVTLDTEATLGITLMSIGVLFDDTRLSYNQAASSSSSYILYGSGKGNNYMTAASTCGGYPQTPPAGCQLAVPGQVNVDYVSTSLTNGTGSTNVGVALLVTLVFDVGATPGFASIALTQSGAGNVIGQPGGASTTATLNSGGGGVNVIPEPTTALLVALGLAGLGIAGRRK